MHMGFVLTSTFRLSLVYRGLRVDLDLQPIAGVHRFCVDLDLQAISGVHGFCVDQCPAGREKHSVKSSYPFVCTLPGCLGRSPGVDMTTVSWITPPNLSGYQCDDTG